MVAKKSSMLCDVKIFHVVFTQYVAQGLEVCTSIGSLQMRARAKEKQSYKQIES